MTALFASFEPVPSARLTGTIESDLPAIEVTV
jgi:hypothetical protein